MKVKDILNYNKIIKDIINNGTNINALTKFKMLGMLKQFEPIVTNLDIVRDEKIREYGTLSDDCGYGIFAPKRADFNNEDDYKKAVDQFEETIKKFNADIEEIVNSESDIKLNKFGAEIMDVGIPADYLLALYDLIEME